MVTCRGIYLLVEFVDLVLIRGQRLFEAGIYKQYAVGIGLQNLL